MGLWIIQEEPVCARSAVDSLSYGYCRLHRKAIFSAHTDESKPRLITQSYLLFAVSAETSKPVSFVFKNEVDANGSYLALPDVYPLYAVLHHYVVVGR